MKTISKICPSCHVHSETDNLNLCPTDGTLLCPVGSHVPMDSLVGDFKLIETLGEGGNSHVYLAEHCRVNLKAAIKFPKCSLLSDPVAVKRFQQESQTIQKLAHDNITALYDFGVTSEGNPYIVMEYVNGQNLAQRLASEGPMSPSEVTSIFLQIADGMEEAHLQGVLHRDLKPSNIMIDEQNIVKIVDFGVAKMTGPENTATVTRTGINLGTPAYMSPEQCLGQELDGRSDIYSLGCVMYECLTGKQVFPSENAFTCMHKHAFEAPPSLSRISNRVPPHLEAVVLKCLAKDPKSRFQSMSDLKAALKGKAVLPGWQDRRSKTLSTAVAAAVFLAIPAMIMFGVLPINQVSVSPPKTIPGDSVLPDSPREQIAEIVSPTPEAQSSRLLQYWFNDIKEEISSLKKEGRFADATTIESELTKYERMMVGAYSAPKSGGSEIHTVGLFQGNGGIHGSGKEVPGYATVDVTYTDNPITLVLSAFHPIVWTVNLAPGAKISKVYLAGASNQVVKGLDKSIKIIEKIPKTAESYGWNNGLAVGYDWDRDYNHYARGVEKVLGQRLSTLLTEYSTRETIIVGPSNNHWRAQHIMSRMRDFHDTNAKRSTARIANNVSQAKFEGLWDSGTDSIISDPCLEIRTLTLSGPTSEPKRKIEFDVFSGVKNPSSSVWFLANQHGLIKYTKEDKAIALVPPKSMPDLCWIRGLAYDAKRDKLVVATQSGTYTYDDRTNNWTMSESRLMEQFGLCYDQAEDCLYGISCSSSEGGAILCKMDHKGAILNTYPIDGGLNYLSAGAQFKIQLSVHGDYVVGIMQADHDPDGLKRARNSFAIDRHTGRMVFSRKLPFKKGLAPAGEGFEPAE